MIETLLDLKIGTQNKAFFLTNQNICWKIILYQKKHFLNQHQIAIFQNLRKKLPIMLSSIKIISKLLAIKLKISFLQSKEIAEN